MAYTTSMVRSSKARSGIALGGIGAGWFELRPDGCTYDWNIFNNKPLGCGEPFLMDNSSMLFFIVRYQEKGKTPKMRLLQIENKYGAAGIRGHEHYYIVPWLSGVDKIEYSGTFPFVTMKFTDRDMPFSVDLEAFSPFIPHDIKNSSLPAAIFNFTVVSKTRNPVDVMIAASMRNGVGYDVQDRAYAGSISDGKGFKAFEMSCDRLDKNHSSWGTMGIGSLSPSASYYLGWEHHHPYYEILVRNPRFPDINDTAGRNKIDEKTGKPKVHCEYCFSSIAASKRLDGPGTALRNTFVAAWCFPNNYAQNVDHGKSKPHVEGHFYSNFFKSSTDVIAYVTRNLVSLKTETCAFRDAFYDTSADTWITDQINSNLNTFFTSSWLTKKGRFGILEGLNSWQNFAGLCTTDVAMYGSVSYAALFPGLARGTMLAFRDLQGKNGKIAHSISRNFMKLPDNELDSPRLDLPSQYAFMALRGFFWSGDKKYLRSIWPSVKKALEYVLRERDKNGDLLPDMEGVMCSYDNFPMFGVASYVAGQFLVAVQAAIEAARILGDKAAVRRFCEVFEKGRAVYEERAWNGRYYRLYNDIGGEKGDTDEGCLTDQIIGQWASHQIGLGYFLDPKRVRTALKNVIKMNYKPEYGLRNCQWPGDGFLHDVDKDTWIDQANTVWTGVELAFASFLLYEGMYREARMVIKNVDARYRKWGMYWDHQEFGGRYFRPMSAWAIVNGLLGLAVNNGRYEFRPVVPGKTIKLFFAFDGGYGHYQRISGPSGETVSLTPVRGTLSVRELVLSVSGKRAKVSIGIGGKNLPSTAYLARIDDGACVVTFKKVVAVKAGSACVISVR